ncbi:MAG TPA: hypothetical protein VJK29_20615 [Terriglobales bacterium]|nr:hypothetical protein [Terriglobales bacterium]
MEWTFLFSFARVGLQKKADHDDGEHGIAFLGTPGNGRRFDTDPGNRRQLRKLEPDGIGQNRLRAIALEAAKRITES